MEMCHFSTWKFQAGSFIQTVGSALLLTLCFGVLLSGKGKRKQHCKVKLFPILSLLFTFLIVLLIAASVSELLGFLAFISSNYEDDRRL